MPTKSERRTRQGGNCVADEGLLGAMKGTLKEVVDDVHHIVDGGDDVWRIGGGCTGGSNNERSERDPSS